MLVKLPDETWPAPRGERSLTIPVQWSVRMALARFRFSTQVPIAVRMTVVVLIPCLIIGALGWSQVAERLAAAGTVAHLGAVTRFSVDVGNLVHELQKERGMSAVFLNSKGAQMAAELPQQHQLGSDRLSAMLAQSTHVDRGTLPEKIGAAIDQALTDVRGLPAWREQVLAKRVPGLESNQFYTRLIASLLAVPQTAVQEAPDPDVTAQMLAYANFLTAKERAGQERASGALGFAAGKFEAAPYRALVSAGAEQALMLQGFTRFASAAQIALFGQTVSGPVVATYETYLRQALTAGPGGDLGGITGTDWYRATTDRINLMKPVEDRLAADLGGLMEARAAEVRATTIVRIGTLAVPMVISIGLAIWLTRGVVRPIRDMTGFMRRLAEGDLTGDVPARDNGDEVGVMTRAVQTFKENRIAAQALEAEQMAMHEVRRKAAERLETLTGGFDAEASALLGQVSAAADTMRTTARSMTHAADQTTRRASEVAGAAEQASTRNR